MFLCLCLVSYLNKVDSQEDNKLHEILEIVPLIPEQQKMGGFVHISQDTLKQIRQSPRASGWKHRGGDREGSGQGRAQGKEKGTLAVLGESRRKQAGTAACGRRTALLRGGDT